MITVQITAELLDELEQKAKAATHGEWHQGTDLRQIEAGNGTIICHVSGSSFNGSTQDDAAHIAAANPATILALVEHIRSLTERMERAEKDAGRISVEDRLPDEHKAEYLCLFGGGDQQVTEWIHGETEGWVFWYGYPTHWRTLPATPSIAQEGAEHE